MCVGIPGQIVEIVDAASDTAVVEICGVRRAVNIACVVSDERNHAQCVGEWVLIHVGFAMSRLDPLEAQKTLELLRELGEMEEKLSTIAEREGRASGQLEEESP
ncbi:HypC/HybG/HupF family hydrogenase formation chaperone [Microbulbifer rhizosphaerae]|uniref:Hydrogenase expression/formation protein HypC n=1 Tax=Microbulbifer rhizosphaerae TaxID=1562603 RepID=A0A7W4WGM8_9GAMM|nr:HypC/HybG/HupF family hydrogenase formation chaperone [Microbulbifer rhizosphaerae]MBB3063427.1 hydrogenase expression/formation protein HypC [Microbulbifer rhizosphaerae]